MTELVLAGLAVAVTVYGISAAGKLHGRAAYRAFKYGLAESRLVTASRLTAVGAALAAAELMVACLGVAAGSAVLASPDAQLICCCALAASTALTVTLTAGVAVVLWRGVTARCACFGSDGALPIGRLHLARNAGLLALLTAGLAATFGLHGRVGLGPGLVAVAAGATCGLLVTRLDDLVALSRPMPAAGRSADR
jgi:hypothetical protein